MILFCVHVRPVSCLISLDLVNAFFLLFQPKQKEMGSKYTTRLSSSGMVPSFAGLYLGEGSVIS